MQFLEIGGNPKHVIFSGLKWI